MSRIKRQCLQQSRKTKKKLPLISDDDIQKHNVRSRRRATHSDILDVYIASDLIVSRIETEGMVARPVSQNSRIQQVGRVFSETSGSIIDGKDNHVLNDFVKKSPNGGKEWGWYNVKKIVISEPKPGSNNNQLYPDENDEGYGSWNLLHEQSNILTFEEKLTRDLFRAFARLQENQGFIPGLIDTQEVLYIDDFKALLTSLGAYPTEELIISAFAKADAMKRGWISYRRFLKAKQWILNQGHEGFDYDNLFNMLDKNNDGLLALSELIGLTTISGHVLTAEETAIYFKEFGKSSVDGINKEEFKLFLSRRQDLAWILRTGYKAVFVIGPPASGKGTYCDELKKMFSINTISTGNLMREEAAAKTTLGKRVEIIMNRGELVDSSTTTVLIQKYLRGNPGKHVFIDGFPRSMQNNSDFFQLCGFPENALLFDAPDEVLFERMRNRCSGRDDDTEETITRRIKVFRETIDPIVQNLTDNGVNVLKMDATRPIEVNIEMIVQNLSL